MCDFWHGLGEGWQIAIVSATISLILGVITYLFKANRDFFKIIDDFHDKLPPQNKKAQKSTEVHQYMTTVNVGALKMNLTTEEIDQFHKKLENFKYDRIIFKKKRIIEFSKNIQRLLNSNSWDEFTISIIQDLLEDENHRKRIPYLFGYRVGQVIGF